MADPVLEINVFFKFFLFFFFYFSLSAKIFFFLAIYKYAYLIWKKARYFRQNGASLTYSAHVWIVQNKHISIKLWFSGLLGSQFSEKFWYETVVRKLSELQKLIIDYQSITFWWCYVFLKSLCGWLFTLNFWYFFSSSIIFYVIFLYYFYKSTLNIKSENNKYYLFIYSFLLNYFF